MQVCPLYNTLLHFAKAFTRILYKLQLNTVPVAKLYIFIEDEMKLNPCLNPTLVDA